jgi:hypothetical protein
MANDKTTSTAEKIEVVDDAVASSIDLAAEKKLLRKCDLNVLPPLFVLFLLAFLDRANIGKHFLGAASRN